MYERIDKLNISKCLLGEYVILDIALVDKPPQAKFSNSCSVCLSATLPGFEVDSEGSGSVNGDLELWIIVKCTEFKLTHTQQIY